MSECQYGRRTLLLVYNRNCETNAPEPINLLSESGGLHFESVGAHALDMCLDEPFAAFCGLVAVFEEAIVPGGFCFWAGTAAMVDE